MVVAVEPQASVRVNGVRINGIRISPTNPLRLKPLLPVRRRGVDLKDRGIRQRGGTVECRRHIGAANRENRRRKQIDIVEQRIFWPADHQADIDTFVIEIGIDLGGDDTQIDVGMSLAE